MPKLKNIIIYVIIAAAVFSAYFFFLRPGPAEENLVSSPGGSLLDVNSAVVPGVGAGEPAVAKNFLSLFLSVKNIKLDGALFIDPVFKSLKDSSITLVPDSTEGRPNPFARLGSDTPPPAPAAPVSPEVPAPDDTSTSGVEDEDLDALLDDLSL